MVFELKFELMLMWVAMEESWKCKFLVILLRRTCLSVKSMCRMLIITILQNLNGSRKKNEYNHLQLALQSLQAFAAASMDIPLILTLLQVHPSHRCVRTFFTVQPCSNLKHST